MADFGNDYVVLLPLDMIYDAVIPGPNTVKVRVLTKPGRLRWKRIVFEAFYFVEDAFLNVFGLASDKLLGLRFQFDGIHHVWKLHIQLPSKILQINPLGFLQRPKGILHIDFVLQCLNSSCRCYRFPTFSVCLDKQTGYGFALIKRME